MTHGHAQATQQGALSNCPACGKKAYNSKTNAKHAARRLYPGRKMRIYNCPGTPWWHLTSQNAARAAAWRDWTARTEKTR